MEGVDFLILMAQGMPMDKLFELVKDRINNYQKDPTKENRQMAVVMMSMCVAKEGSDGQTAEEAMKDFRDSRQILKHFKETNGKN